MRSLVSRRTATAVVCAALLLGTAGPAVASSHELPRSVDSARPADTTSVPADLTDDVWEAVRQVLDSLLGSGTTNDPSGVVPPVSEVLTSVGTPVGDLLGGEQPAPGGPTPLPAPVPDDLPELTEPPELTELPAPAELPTGNQTQEITEPPELTKLPAPADLPTGNQTQEITEPPELTKLPTPADLPTGNQTQEITEPPELTELPADQAPQPGAFAPATTSGTPASTAESMS